MNISTDMSRILQFIERPAFAVKDHKILWANTSAGACNITTESNLRTLLQDGLETYEAYTNGVLFLSVYNGSNRWSATVEKMDDWDLFVLDTTEDSEQLKALSLASVFLRAPLSGLKNCIEESNHTAQRMLHQMHRAINNMSDASRYQGDRKRNLRVQEISGFIHSIVESVSAKVESIDVTITFKGLPAAVYTLVDEELLERAILNMLSNSIKAGAKHITISLSRHGKTLHLTMEDDGSGVPVHMQQQMFQAYRRTPTLNDGNCGIGLGMVIIRAAAHAHQGTVLLEQKDGQGLRVTMTLSVMQNPGMLHSSSMRFDYNGFGDHILTELSDILPDTEY